jgi:hypothetical protein
MTRNNLHPYLLAIMLLLPAFLSGPASAGEAEKAADEQPAEKEKPEAEEPEAEDAGIKESFPFSFNDVADHLVIIECRSEAGKSAGSGFVAKMDGKTYIFTNQHVIMGADRIEFQTVSGEQLNDSIRGVELSLRRDIARILIEDREALTISKSVLMGVPLAVFGNSEGGGVATELYGEVTGVGAELVEVTAEFVSGNSGSPVINRDREVIGIASYVKFSQPTRMTEGTPFEDKTRRFCYRLTGDKWVKVNWKKYNEKYGKPYQETVMMVETVFALISGLFEEPFGRVKESYPDADLARWSSQHNRAVSSSGTQRRREVGKSTKALSNYCERKARVLEMKLESRDLTGFLRDEFETYLYLLEYASEAIDFFNTKLPQL